MIYIIRQSCSQRWQKIHVVKPKWLGLGFVVVIAIDTSLTKHLVSSFNGLNDDNWYTSGPNTIGMMRGISHVV